VVVGGGCVSVFGSSFSGGGGGAVSVVGGTVLVAGGGPSTDVDVVSVGGAGLTRLGRGGVSRG